MYWFKGELGSDFTFQLKLSKNHISFAICWGGGAAAEHNRHIEDDTRMKVSLCPRDPLPLYTGFHIMPPHKRSETLIRVVNERQSDEKACGGMIMMLDISRQAGTSGLLQKIIKLRIWILSAGVLTYMSSLSNTNCNSSHISLNLCKFKPECNAIKL